MTDHPHPQTAISPAVDIAVALACLVHEMTGENTSYLGSGGLVLGYEFTSNNQLRIDVDWQGVRVLQVALPLVDESGPWIAEMANTLGDLRQATAEPGPVRH